MIMRAYKYRAFPPTSGVAEFESAIGLKRELWKALIAIEDDYNARKASLTRAPDYAARIAAAPTDNARAALRAERQRHIEAIKPDLLALGSWRVAEQRTAKQRAAAAGLHWGDYNAVVFQFDGARAAAKARGAVVYNFETACGEALVNQVMNGRRPAQMIGFSQCDLQFRANANGTKHKPKSHRAQYQAATIDMTLRGPRNPLGAARLSLDLVMHRPLPPNAMVKEVRAIRTWRKVMNREGQCFDRTDWAVVFVMVLPAVESPRRGCAGLSLTWRGSDAEDGLQPYGFLNDGFKTKTLTMDFGYEADWARRTELVQRAAASGDAADQMIADNFTRRLLRRRQLAQREAAAQIASRYACIAVQKVDLSGKGNKKNTAPAAFRLALKHALEARGGKLIEVGAPIDKSAREPHKIQAKVLFEAARRANSNATSPTNFESDHGVAA